MDLTRKGQSPLSITYAPRAASVKRGRTDRSQQRPHRILLAETRVSSCSQNFFSSGVYRDAHPANQAPKENKKIIQNSGFDPVQRAGLAFGAFRHVFARREGFPQVAEERCLLLYIFIAEEGCNGKRGFFAVVEGDAPDMVSLMYKNGQLLRDSREDVVHDVVLDDAVENVAPDEAKLAVDGRHCAFLVCPGALLVVRCFRVCVVQVCDCDWAG